LPKKFTLPEARIFADRQRAGLGICRFPGEVIGEAPGPPPVKNNPEGNIAGRPGEFGSGRRTPILRSDIAALSCLIASDLEHCSVCRICDNASFPGIHSGGSD
jgi:hypothetical protein